MRYLIVPLLTFAVFLVAIFIGMVLAGLSIPAACAFTVAALGAMLMICSSAFGGALIAALAAANKAER